MPKPRIRSIKPDLVDSEKVAGLSDEAFRVWVCAITQADDHGSFAASDGHILRFLGFRGESPRFAAARGELAQKGFADFYVVRGKTFGRIHGWANHQRIDNARKEASEYYPKPDDGEPLTSFQFDSVLPAAARGEPPTPAAVRRERRRPAAGLEGIGEEGKGGDKDLVAPSATGRKAKREPLPYKPSEVYAVLAEAMGDAFADAMPDGEGISKGIAIAVNNVLREAGELGYTLEDFKLAGEYVAAYMRALGSPQTLTPSWVAQTDPNKGGLLKAVMNARVWDRAGRPTPTRGASNGGGRQVGTGAAMSPDELAAWSARQMETEREAGKR